MKKTLLLILCFTTLMAYSQDTIVSYKKRVLESVEIDLLASYYSQDGDNAAVTGGIGTEELTDLASSIVISIPLNDDAILKIDANVSAYTSASSSNVSPFDSGQPADPFVADSGASANDLWLNAWSPTAIVVMIEITFGAPMYLFLKNMITLFWLWRKL